MRSSSSSEDAFDYPPLDAHAHVDVAIAPRDLLSLRAVVLAATRSIAEHEQTLNRRDPLAIWGVGVHPGVPTAIASFDPRRCRTLLRRASLLSEVGLDGRSSVGLVEQRRVMSAALDIHDELPCFASVHSASRTAEVVELLSGHRCSTVILHWWRGSRDETREAVKLGCYFSFNPRDAKRGSVLDIVPVDRVLTETDHPYGDLGLAVSAPGATAAVEARLNPTNPAAARLQVWSNFRRLAEEAGVMDRLPSKIAGLALAAPRS